jgi:dimethylargininase
MTLFRNAIVRTPCAALAEGLSTASLGKPDLALALRQHENYIATLRDLGLEVRVLGSDDAFPDSVFIEDAALCTASFAVITMPGADSRRGEISGMKEVLENYYENVREIKLPGTLEAGDIMMAGNHFFIGLSQRTNTEGARQLIALLAEHGMSGSVIPLKNLLHLKSGAAYLENNNMLVCDELNGCNELRSFNRITVPADESYSANSLWINGTVLVPAGFYETKSKIEDAGYKTIELKVSEFRKLDGGLSCLSLRF